MNNVAKILACAALTHFSAPATAADVDKSLLPVCSGLAIEPTPESQRALLNHPVMDKLKQGFGADFLPDPDLAAKAERISETVAFVEANLDGLVKRAHAPKILLPDGAIPPDFKMHFVCGTPSDGYGFVFDGKTELFIDVGNVTADFLPHLLMHEFWHVGFKNAYPEQFQAEFHSGDPLRRVAYQMVNEGVGHYYSMRRRLVPKITYEDWHDRTANIFSLLHEKVPGVLSAETAEAQEQLIFRGHAGVPYWQKWLAVPGAIITYRLIGREGEAEVARLIAAGPCAFLSRYNTLADPERGELVPEVIVEAACAA